MMDAVCFGARLGVYRIGTCYSQEKLHIRGTLEKMYN